MKDSRSLTEIRLAAAKRLLMVYGLKSLTKSIVVTEFPKSGGSWFCQLLSAATDIPFPRNVTPRFGQNILHGHYPYSRSMGKAVGVVRDGRDVIVSAYYHFLFENNRNLSKGVQRYRKLLPFSDYEDIKNNLPEFIEFMFSSYSQGWLHFNWADFVDMLIKKPSLLTVKYENLLVDPIAELQRTITFLNLEQYSKSKDLQKIVDYYSFGKQKARASKTGQKSFLRKGKSGDWKNHFSPQAKILFNEFAGQQLIEIGYEKDEHWVK